MKKYLIVLSLFALISSCTKKENDINDERPETNLDEISIVVDKTTVVAAEQIRFDITGRADVLTFYSGEVGRDFHENRGNGVETKGRVDYYTYIFPEPGQYDVYFLLQDLRGNERTIGPFQINVEENPLLNPALVTGTLAGTIGSPNFAFDLAGLESYAPGSAANPGNAQAVPEKIDMLILMIGGVPSFCLPPGVGSGTSSGVYAFTTKNDGVLFKISDPTAEEIARFEGLKRRKDLIAAFEIEEELLPNRPGYVPTNIDNISVHNHGPLTGGMWGSTTARMRGANVGDLFYFKSLSRDLYAAFRITSSGGANTTPIELEVKSILFED